MNQHSTSDREPKTRRGRETRDKLLHAAEAEFGQKGFHDASIAEITRRAGVALGTFYTYFESKEEIFRALVAYMGRFTRHWIAERIGDATDRLTAERRGLQAFFDLVHEHRNLYRIVSEAQFVAEDAYRDYYVAFAAAYQQRLEDAAARGELHDGDYEVWSWALIGMHVFLGMRYAAWEEASDSRNIGDALAGLIGTGMLAGNNDGDT